MRSEKNDDTLIAYSSKTQQLCLLAAAACLASYGLYLIISFDLTQVRAWIGIAVIVVASHEFMVVLATVPYKGPLIKADETGLFIYGQTVSPIRWEDIASAEHGSLWGAKRAPSMYVLRVSEDSRHLIQPSRANFYTGRVLRLSSFGTTASGTDIRRVLKARVPALLWHIESDATDKEAG